MLVRGIPSGGIPEIWFHVEHHIRAALEVCPFWSAEDIREMLEIGAAQLFELDNFRSIVITRVEQYPQALVMEILLAAGEIQHVMLLPQFEAWGRSLGCTHFQFMGRKGWAKLHPEYDQQVLLRRSLWPVVAEAKQ